MTCNDNVQPERVNHVISYRASWKRYAGSRRPGDVEGDVGACWGDFLTW